MASRKITISSVKELTPGTTLWDTDVKGFGCRCQKLGKFFIVKYRLGRTVSARQRFFTIGRLGSPWTPDTAREEAKRILGLVAHGQDPAGHKMQENQLPDVKTAFDSFMDLRDGKRGERTQAEYRRMFDKLAKPEIGGFRITDITGADIERLHRKFAHIPHQANRMLQMLSSFFNWCERREYRPERSNPCRGIDKYRELPRERFLSEDELFRLSAALSVYEQEYGLFREHPWKKDRDGEAEENRITPYITAAVRLLIFTGARRGEILNLQWKDVDFKNRLIRLQESKTGQKTIYLSAPALQILSEIPRIDGNPYVICGKGDGAGLVNIKRAWNTIRQIATLDIWRQDEKLAALVDEAAAKLPEGHSKPALFSAVQKLAAKRKTKLPEGITDVHIHDLRHNYASTAVAAGHHLKVIGSLLGHADTKTTERYAHLANDPLQTASETISKRLLDAMTGGGAKNNVVPLAKGGKSG